MSAPLEAVLFDLDGTLLDSVDLIVASFEHTIAAAGLAPRTRAEILEDFGRPLLAVLPEWSGQPERTDELICTYREWNLAHHDQLARPYPGVSEAVAALGDRGLRLGVVTSKPHDSARRGLRVCGIEARMEALVGCDDLDQYKPHPAPVLAGCELLKVSPARCVYVGDAVVDIQAGRAAGVRTAAALWGVEDDRGLREQRPDFWLTQPSELLDLLQG